MSHVTLENYKQLLSELGQAVGLPELAPDADNYCCLGFDDKIVLHLQFNAENEILMLFAQIGKIDDAYKAAIYPRILKANLFWQGTGGSTLGVDDNGEVLMAYQIMIGGMDFQKFQDLLEGFVNTAELWINTLDAVQKSSELLEESKRASGISTGPNMTMPDSGMRA